MMILFLKSRLLKKKTIFCALGAHAGVAEGQHTIKECAQLCEKKRIAWVSFV
jgi:hypothetical protein